MKLEQVRASLEGLIGSQLTDTLSWLYWNVVLPTVSPFYWLWVLSACALACLYFLFGAQGRRPGGSLLCRLFPREIYLHASARLDYRFYVLNQVLVSQLRLGAWVGAVVGFFQVSHAVKALLAAVLGQPQQHHAPDGAVLLLFTLCALIATDFGRFMAHYLQHKVPLLWEFHKVHHAAEVLTPITGQRSHAVDLMLDLTLRLVFTGIVAGVFGYVYPGGGMAELTILSFNAIAVFIYHPFALLSHSHVRLGYGPVFSRMLISPLMHQIHHSMERQHWDKNFGFGFSLWDRCFGTLYVPRADEQFRLGLPSGNGRFDSVWSLFLDPFVRAFDRASRRRAPTGLLP